MIYGFENEAEIEIEAEVEVENFEQTFYTPCKNELFYAVVHPPLKSMC